MYDMYDTNFTSFIVSRMDVGIKRRPTNGERVSRLNRKCRVFYRLCIMKKVTLSDRSSDWILVEWAQLVTQAINCGKCKYWQRLYDSIGSASMTQLATHL